MTRLISSDKELVRSKRALHREPWCPKGGSGDSCRVGEGGIGARHLKGMWVGRRANVCWAPTLHLAVTKDATLMLRLLQLGGWADLGT